MEDIEAIFLTKIKPFEERIRILEESEKDKEAEITTLKHAISNLNRVIENLKAQQASVAKPAIGGNRAIPNKTNSSITPPSKDNKAKENGPEEEKVTKTVKPFIRPQTANPVVKDKLEKPDPKAAKAGVTGAKDTKAKDKEEKKTSVADKDKDKSKLAKKGDKNAKPEKNEKGTEEKTKDVKAEENGESTENGSTDTKLETTNTESKPETEKVEGEGEKLEGDKPVDGGEEEEVM